MKIVYKFGAEWCANCKVYTALFAGYVAPVKALYPDVQFVNVDVDTADGAALVGKYGVRGLPSTVFTVDDAAITTVTGVVKQEEMVGNLCLVYGENAK